MPKSQRRHKISTTIAPENNAYLRAQIRRGKAANMAEAVDRAVSMARKAERRRSLEEATAAYYASLSGHSLRAERELEQAVGQAASRVDYDGE